MIHKMKPSKTTLIENKLVVTSREKEGERGNTEVEGHTIMYEIHKLQECIVQHRKNSQYFIMTIKEI